MSGGKLNVLSLGITVSNGTRGNGESPSTPPATSISCTSTSSAAVANSLLLEEGGALTPLPSQPILAEVDAILGSLAISASVTSGRTAHISQSARAILFQAAHAKREAAVPSAASAASAHHQPLLDGFTAYTAGRAVAVLDGLVSARGAPP